MPSGEIFSETKTYGLSFFLKKTISKDITFCERYCYIWPSFIFIKTKLPEKFMSFWQWIYQILLFFAKKKEEKMTKIQILNKVIKNKLTQCLNRSILPEMSFVTHKNFFGYQISIWHSGQNLLFWSESCL